jgi:hypothetical protein
MPGLFADRSGVIWNGIPYEPRVIPAKAGIQSVESAFPKVCRVDSRFRGNDDGLERPCLANDTTTPPLLRLTTNFRFFGCTFDGIFVVRGDAEANALVGNASVSGAFVRSAGFQPAPTAAKMAALPGPRARN